MVPSLTEDKSVNSRKKILNPAQINCDVQPHHGRQQIRTVRTPAGLESEQFRLRAKTINGIILSSLFAEHARQAPLRESFGEVPHAACMTGMISGPRYGSTVGTSLVISANSSVRARRLDLPTKEIHVAQQNIPWTEEENVHASGASPKKNPDSDLSSWEYLSRLGVIPSEHYNRTLGAVREQQQAASALFAVRAEPQIPNKRSEYDSVNSPAPGFSNHGHPHCF